MDGRTAEELIAKCIAPVKAAHWRKVGPKPQEQTATSDSHAPNGRSDGSGGQGKSRGEGAPGGKGGRQSKKQWKQIREEQRQADLCLNFVHSQCTYGDRCKFNHDIAGYVQARRLELPGECPFSALPQCPYGITCRWATHHKSPDELTRKWLLGFCDTAPPSTAGTTPAQHAGDAATQAVPVQQQNAEAAAQKHGLGDERLISTAGPAGAVSAQAGSTSLAQNESRNATPTAAPIDNGLPSTVLVTGKATAAAGAASAADGSTCGQKVVPGRGSGEDGSIPEAPVALPLQASVGEPLNTLPKDVQIALRRDQYDFSRADATVVSFGGKISRKQRLDGRQQPKGRGKRADPSQGRAQQAGAAGAAGAAGIGHEAKRQRLDTDSSAAPAAVDQPVGSQSTSQGAAQQAQQAEDAQQQAKGANGTTPAGSCAAASTEPTQPSGAKTSALPASDAKMHPVKLYDVKRAEAAVSGQNGLADLDMDVPLRPVEKKTVDFRGKLYLAPLTTVGNLPYRVVCKHLGADITCGEMALGTNLLQAQASEWALLKRHPCEDVFGIQVCGGYSDMLTRMAQLVEENLDVSFVDVNMGCPIDIICNRSAGSALLLKPNRIKQIARSMSSVLSCPLTLKMRKGYSDNHDVVHTFVSDLPSCGVSALTLHGRTRAQRYSRLADWEYIKQCTEAAPGLQIIGNGDIFSYTDYEQHMADAPQLATTMLARGALIKPWLFTEIKERRHWDISAGERLDILKDFCSAGLQHWGSDNKGVETTRRFLLEFLSFLHRYIPAGVLDVIPQKLHWRPPTFYGRNDLETLFGSAESADWVRISEMLLGPVPDTFHFTPKHKSNAYKGGGSEAGMAFEGDAGEENG